MIRSLFIACLATISLAFGAQGQTPTVGVLNQTEASFDGYTLLPVTASAKTFLINNCGEVINEWNSGYKAGMIASLLPDGSLLRAGRTNNANFGAGGTGGLRVTKTGLL